MILQTKKRIVLISILIIVLLIGSVCAYFYYGPHKTNKDVQVETVIIEKNDSGAEIAEKLYDQGLIDSKMTFRLALRVNGVMDKLQEGYYRIPNNISLHELVSVLQKGNVESIKVTFPEGFTLEQIATRLEEEKVVSKADFLREAKVYVPYNYMYGDKPVTYHVEGFLYPSTYEFPVHVSAKDVLKTMTSEMNKKLTPSVREKIKEKGLTIYEFITLASLVEREALFDEDRPIIASVFLKRLSINMPLQSCASIEYLLGTRKPILSIEDTQIDSPYNTYLHTGLPPGPIANPSEKSMEAVLNAKATDYLYFVADEKGHHHFSKTYDEHLKTIESIYGKE